MKTRVERLCQIDEVLHSMDALLCASDETNWQKQTNPRREMQANRNNGLIN